MHGWTISQAAAGRHLQKLRLPLGKNETGASFLWRCTLAGAARALRFFLSLASEKRDSQTLRA
jgi:hypothetical protein